MFIHELALSSKVFVWANFTIIIESVDSISRDERDVPLMQYITNA